MDAIRTLAGAIRLLTCDVDGVLTDGRIYINASGEEMKAFSVLDGVGLKALAAAGVAVAWISGGSAPAIAHRARSLDVREVVLGTEDKLAAWESIRVSLELPPEACAHVGDDLPDLPVFARCGLAIAVPGAPSSVRERAHYVTRRDGGAGAVREVCDLILDAQRAHAG